MIRGTSTAGALYHPLLHLVLSLILAAATLCSCQSAAQKVAARPTLFEQSVLRPRLSEEAELWRVRKIMRAMSLEQKIGQRFICWIAGKTMSEQVEEMVRQGAAGLILYPWNIEGPEQVRRLTAAMQQAARAGSPPIGFFICVDQEGGRVAALRFPEMSRLAPAWYWGRQQDPRYVEAAAYLTGREIRALGCNMNLAPVLDLYGRADSTIIGDRSLGIDPVTVGTLGIHYLRGARRAEVIPVIKHFPGHGSSTVDSHGRLPVVDLPEQLLLERDFKPFLMAIEAGAEALMTAHILFPRIDPDYPVTLSRHILRDILRDRFGYQGVIISDGLAMGALAQNFSISDSLKLMIQAELDLILVHSRYDLVDLKLEVLRLLHQGVIDEEQIDVGVERILRLKLRYGLLPY